MYRNRLLQLGIADPSVHATRLKNLILAHLPYLSAFKEGQDILIISREDVGSTLRKACEDDVSDDTLTLIKAARIVRKEMLSQATSFNGTFEENCQGKSVPASLLTLVTMLLYGTNIKDQSDVTESQCSLSISQLVQFNSLTCQSKGAHTQTTQRHNKLREPPLPVYLGVLIHNKTRKREIVEKLHDLGLSMSYDRVLEISTDVGTKLCKSYEKFETVCPPQLKKTGFTTSAVDNINHQTSATTAKTSFNGTGISVFQHFDTKHAATLEPALPPDEIVDTFVQESKLS